MPKSITIAQPVFIPWLGYFEQMAMCDEFMFLDDVQYTKHNWRNRNRIKTADGSMWLTIPVKRGPLKQSLQDTEINYQTRWITKHLNAIKTNYRRAPYYCEILPIIEEVYEKQHPKLIDLTIELTLAFKQYLGIDTPIYYSSQIQRQCDGRLARVAELCQARLARILYNGPAGKDYIDPEYLAAKGIHVVYQNYVHPQYSQRFSGFQEKMSILDLLMNMGPASHEILLSSPLPSQLCQVD